MWGNAGIDLFQSDKVASYVLVTETADLLQGSFDKSKRHRGAVNVEGVQQAVTG